MPNRPERIKGKKVTILGMARSGLALARLVKDSATRATVDMRQPQPGWAIAVGLALGITSE